MRTEASPLTYPENASLAEENFVLNRDGSRQRRLGMDYEEGFVKYSKEYVEGSNGDIEHFLWKNAGNVQNQDISVLKIKDKFWFYDNNAEVVSSAPLNGGASLTVSGLDPTGSGNPVIYNYTFINGKMVVVSGLKTIGFLTYDAVSDTVSLENRTISIRDTFGIHDDRPIDNRPVFGYDGNKYQAGTSFLDPDEASIHIYNLDNQGWQDDLSQIMGTYSTGSLVYQIGDSLAVTESTASTSSRGQNYFGIGSFPSNSDTIFSNLSGVYYDPRNLLHPIYGTHHAPKGHIIFEDMFNRGSTRKKVVSDRSGIRRFPTGSDAIGTLIHYPIKDVELSSDHDLEATIGGISAVASYNGRLIYTVYENSIVQRDDESPSFGDMLFFSQATDGTKDLTKCHTDLDPTSGEEFALLDTDGGYITLSGIGTINSLEVLGSSLFVFSDNGVWQINGGSSLFTASNINVKKITNIGNINRKGIVVAGNRLFYLTDAGLFEVILNENDVSLPASVINISQTTIQAFFDDLSLASKQKAVASHDRYANSIKWLFASTGLPDDSYFNIELTLDLNLNAFYVNTIKDIENITGEGSPYVVAYLERPSAIIVDTSSRIVVNGNPVVVSGDPVQITFRSIDSSILSSDKYWVASKVDENNLNFSVAEYKDLQFRDWGSIQNTLGSFGTDANAFLLTGYLTGGDSSSNKRITYITSHFRRTERIFSPTTDGFEPDNPSSCTLTAQWEWTSSANAGRWSRPQEIYKLPRAFIPDVGEFDYGFEVVTTKTKLRGKGKALSLLFQSKPLHDCHLYGWSYEINSEQSV